MAYPTNIRLGFRGLQGTKTAAYETSWRTKKKNIITFTPVHVTLDGEFENGLFRNGEESEQSFL